MMLINLFKRKPLTHDDVLADNLRKAVTAYNEALDRVKGAGLSVSIETRWPGSFGGEYLESKKLVVSGIYRRTTDRL